MKKLTYKEAYDKIIEAYFKDEIKPMDNRFCFCGTLNDNISGWRYNGGSGYLNSDFLKMENALFSVFEPDTTHTPSEDDYQFPSMCKVLPRKGKKYEEKLFEGMCAALEVLKQIHKDRGENVEDFQFTKRELV